MLLTREEELTLAAYEKIAKVRQALTSKPDFWLPEFNQFKELLPVGRVLDIGCGGGIDAVLLLGAGYNYIGIDASPAMLLAAIELVPDAEFREMNMYKLEFVDGTFNGFWAAASFLHVPKTNIPAVLAEAKRVLSPDGVGFIALKEGIGEGIVANRYASDERFFAFYGLEEFTKILKDNGFDVLSSARDATRDKRPVENPDIYLTFFVRKR